MYYLACVVLAVTVMEFLLLPIYIRFKRSERHRPLMITLKGCMTLIAVLFCGTGIYRIYERTGSLFNLTTANGFHTDILVLIGLFVCMIADMVLSIRFKYGMIAFLVGHLCYIAYFIRIAPVNPLSVPVFVVLLIGTYMYFSRLKDNMGGLRIAFYIYGTVILITFSLGIMLPFSLGPYGVFPAIAAVLLVISDFMLALNTVYRKKILADLLYLGYYFTGQFFLALSVFLPVFLDL